MDHNHNLNHENHGRTLYDFLPLIFIISSIILLTGLFQWYQGFSMHGAMSHFMGFFFLVFGSFKLANWHNFVEAYRMYDLIAKKSIIYAYAYPLIEIALGILYLLNWQSSLVNILTFIIMLISAVGVLKELFAGREITCACLGTVFKIPMTWVTFAEDIVMAIMALIMLLSSRA